MNFSDPALQQYIADHSTSEPPLLQKLARETHLKVLNSNMLSGPQQGRILQMFVHMLRPTLILEIGTFTGYSALWMAQALPSEGKLYTLDINQELEDMVRQYIREAGLEDKIEYQIGNALDIIPTLTVTFDLVFIDADKINYKSYYDMTIDKVRQNGFIIADNVLWKGRVATEDPKKKDKLTDVIKEFNAYVHNDPRVENVLLPIRDGLMVARKL